MKVHRLHVLSNMVSSIKLISVRQIPETSAQDEFIWICQTGGKWMPFPDAISATIEKAFRHGFKEIFIDGMYRIDLKYFVREYIDDSNHKQPIRRRRRHLKSSLSSNEMIENESRRFERFSFPLGSTSSCSACVDTDYYGSPFVAKWFLTFTKGKQSVTFTSIFPVLVQGLIEEGQTEPEHVVHDIVDTLNKVKNEALRNSEKKRMEKLENCCAILYTKPCFIYRIVNIALRDDDHTKLRTLGPFCFLVFNYIGRHLSDEFSIRHRFRQTLHPTESHSMTIFRGDYISPEILQQYQQAVVDNSKYFKWLPFASTSRDQDVAEDFACNGLYIINLEEHLSNDQYRDVSTISSCKEEKEILLRPGVRFQVVKVEFDDTKSLHLVHINIVPSYVSSLR